MQKLPYGTWHSPIAAADLARSSIALTYVRAVGGAPFWLESRPAEGGRYVIVTQSCQGEMRVLTPEGFNARTRVHEYGGVPYVLVGSNEIYFSNFVDQRLYVQRVDSVPEPLTPEGYRYADCDWDPAGRRLYCVREDHTAGGEPKNAIVSLPASGGTAGQVLFGDSDFVGYPRVSHDGRRIAWIAWNHPDMPWDTAVLYVANLTDTGITRVIQVAGGPREAVLEPRWAKDGSLYFVSDRSNWWNLYRWSGNAVEAVFSFEAEIASPLWALGQSNYALTGDGRAILRYSENALDRFGVVDLQSGQLESFDLPFNSLSSVVLMDAHTALMIAASATEEPAVVSVDLTTRKHKVLRAPADLRMDPTFVSVAEAVEFPTDGGRNSHAFFYPPRNPGCAAPADEKPPLIVKVHGGPTNHSKAELSLATQYWTSRGFAFLDVNHGGSSGFGRAYRERLDGNWGLVDVADVVAAVRYLAKLGRVDLGRCAIRGGSAGGFTVLSALAFHDVFKAGANYYGVSDLEALAQDTHKFESRYLDRLVAPWPEGRDIYRERSPINHLEAFRAPLIVFQGSDDKVVPPSQSRAIVAALKSKAIPVAYIEFEGEQHGFRRAENLVRSMEAELAFYGQVFGFQPAGALQAVTME